jgi:hypothetical protein
MTLSQAWMQHVFRTGEMRRIRNCAGSLIVGVRQILDALDLLVP